MPLYEYQCAECGPFAQLFSIRETSTTAECPLCRRESKKLFPVVNLREMRPENRLAWERNERSAHAPKACGYLHNPEVYFDLPHDLQLAVEPAAGASCEWRCSRSGGAKQLIMLSPHN